LPEELQLSKGIGEKISPESIQNKCFPIPTTFAINPTRLETNPEWKIENPMRIKE